MQAPDAAKLFIEQCISQGMHPLQFSDGRASMRKGEKEYDHHDPLYCARQTHAEQYGDGDDISQPL